MAYGEGGGGDRELICSLRKFNLFLLKMAEKSCLQALLVIFFFKRFAGKELDLLELIFIYLEERFTTSSLLKHK